MVKRHNKKRKKYVEGTKLKSVPFCQWKLRTIFGDSVFTGSPDPKNMKWNDFFLEILVIYQLNLIVKLTNVELGKKIFLATTRLDIIKLFGVILLITRCKFCIMV